EAEYRFADGEVYRLRTPSYQLTDLAYGSLGSDIRISPRVAPMVFGLGLLEAVHEKTIVELARASDQVQDGIAGRPNFVWNIAAKRKVVGRFGWKASMPNLRQQNAAALRNEMGITSWLFPNDDIVPQASPAGTPVLDKEI